MSNYIPFDGDYDETRTDELSKLAADLLGDRFSESLEICVTFEDGGIRVMGSDDGEEWEWNKIEPLPDGWPAGQVEELLEETVYFKPQPDNAIRISHDRTFAGTEFTAWEQCGGCQTEFQFTVGSILTGPDKNIITPTEPIVCPECGVEYRFDATEQEWKPAPQAQEINGLVSNRGLV